MSYSGTDADTSTAEVHDVNLADGANSVTITVTDGGESDTYTLGVNRAVTADYGWKADSDFDTLKLAGNKHPRGIWSDGAATVYVSDYNDDVVYAYNTDGTRDSAKDFAVSEYPNGIWSDGTTLWVADSGEDKLLAYTLASGARDADEDFDTLDDADNETPRGVFSDGTTMWVADSDEDKIYAYKMSDKSRDADEDFDTLDAAGNNAPRDIWSDGTTMWVAGLGRRQDLRLQDVRQVARCGQRLRYAGRRRQRQPAGAVVARVGPVGERRRRRQALRLQPPGGGGRADDQHRWR